MTNNDFKKLVNKYALIIFIGYSLNFIIGVVFERIIPIGNEGTLTFMSTLLSLTWLIQLIINIIAAILISKDMKRINIKNNFIILATIFFSLIGISMFFITANKEIVKTSA